MSLDHRIILIGAMVCLLVAVTVAVFSVTSSLPEENDSVQQDNDHLKLPWEISHYQQRNDDEHSTSPPSSHLTLGPSSFAANEDHELSSLLNDESGDVSIQQREILGRCLTPSIKNF